MVDKARTAPENGWSRPDEALRNRSAASAPKTMGLRRSRDDRVIAGVCGGLAENLGIRPLVLRVGVAVLAAIGGTGVVLYVAGWLLIPASGSTRNRPSRLRLVAGGVLIFVAVLVFAGSIFDPGFMIPVAIAAVGIAVVWDRIGGRSGDTTGAPNRSGMGLTVRILVGTLLLAGGVVWILAATDSITRATTSLLPIGLTLVGVGILLGPLLWRMWTNLRAERRQRIRSEERAELAAHLHDSVLQTLALIQRHPEQTPQVAALARHQERELRDWLNGTDTEAGGESLKVALEAVAAEVELQYGVEVEVVTVGSATLDARLVAVTQAAREAVVNAAKFSGADTVSVYAEATDGGCSVFVRDRGRGFDVAEVEPDRRGIAESIVGRVERHGGSAQVRSAPGDGTEVELYLPLSA